MSTHVLYIPGLGDGYDTFRNYSLRLWRIGGVHTSFVPMKWFDKQSMNEKVQRISNKIDSIPSGDSIVLIGESAGAAMALHMAANNTRVSKVITVCGVARKNTPVSQRLRSKSPALNEAVNTLPEVGSVQVHSIRALYDGVIEKEYTVAAGAKSHIVWAVGHLYTIILCLTLYAPILIAIAKSNKS